MRDWNAERAERINQEQIIRQLAITEATSDLIATTDIDGFLISLNKAGFDLLGIDPEEDISATKLANFYTTKASRALSREEIPNAIKFSVWHSETTLKAANGDEVPCSQVLISHRDKHSNITFFSVILRDIRPIRAAEDERRELMEQLHQSKKMETIGRLAGGVAHDFNNILTVIMGYAELALLNVDSNQIAKEELEIILTSAQKAARLSNQLLDFSSKQMIEPQSLDLNEIINGSLQLMESLLGEEIQLNLNLAEGLWPVNIDHSQIEQVILNLAVNSRDAIIANGLFTLQTENIALNSAEATRIGLDAAGEYILFTISDTGCGMDDEVMEHIFEPFYTTKKAGKGTGLGLAAVYGAIKQNNGHIKVSSQLGRGTSFYVYLHRGMNDNFIPLNISDDELSRVQGNETILLVEDNKDVRQLLLALLGDLGYQVKTAENGLEALSKFKNSSQAIDMVISDVVMPQMDGVELCTKLHNIEPELPVLLISGHTDRIIAIREMDDNNIKLLSKPIPAEVLALEIRSLLD